MDLCLVWLTGGFEWVVLVICLFRVCMPLVLSMICLLFLVDFVRFC